MPNSVTCDPCKEETSTGTASITASLDIGKGETPSSTATLDSIEKVLEQPLCASPPGKPSIPKTYATELLGGEMDLESLLEQAWSFKGDAVNDGIYGARVFSAIGAFDTARRIGTLILECPGASERLQMRALELIISVCIGEAELHLVLFQHKEVKGLLTSALQHHTTLVALSRTDEQTTHDDNFTSINLAVLEADIYRCLSVVDYRQGNDEHQKWDEQGTVILQNAIATEPNNPKAKSLLSLFLSYKITTANVDSEEAVRDCEKAIDFLGELYEQNADSPDHELHARRLSVVLRLSSYAFRDVGRFEEATEAVRGALEIIKVLCNQRPRAPIHLFELFHCNCALAEHLEACDDDDRFVLDARIEAAAALNRLTEMLPNVPKYWRSLCNTLIDVADLQERGRGDVTVDQNHHDTQALQTASRALHAANQCITCMSSTPIFEDYVEYARALLERGRHTYIQKRYEEALPFYEQSLNVYRKSILPNPRARREDEFYAELALRSMQTASSCAVCGENRDKGIWFLQQAREVGQHVKLRKNKLLYAMILVELAELHYKEKEASKACGILIELLDWIIPYTELYPWHASLITVYGEARVLLAKCYESTGDHVREASNRRKYLEYATRKHGRDYSEWTDQESDLNKDELERLRAVCERVPPVKKYRLPVKKSGQVSWITIEIGSAIEGADPLEDQARLLREDYSVEIASDIRESFRKIHALALQNNVPLTELCDYALSSSSTPSGDEDDGTATTAGTSTEGSAGEDEDPLDRDRLALLEGTVTSDAPVPNVVHVTTTGELEQNS
mmetsp:Transcript_27371/g.75458  ORF Transcript_27371/g.75458 Transcript_27371/m.75458 type:complete len:798 (-) Transcript_27371:1539-3932(-)